MFEMTAMSWDEAIVDRPMYLAGSHGGGAKFKTLRLDVTSKLWAKMPFRIGRLRVIKWTDGTWNLIISDDKFISSAHVPLTTPPPEDMQGYFKIMPQKPGE